MRLTLYIMSICAALFAASNTPAHADNNIVREHIAAPPHKDGDMQLEGIPITEEGWGSPCGILDKLDSCRDTYNALNGEMTVTERSAWVKRLKNTRVFVAPRTGQKTVLGCDSEDNHDYYVAGDDQRREKLSTGGKCADYAAREQLFLLGCTPDYRLCEFHRFGVSQRIWINPFDVSPERR